MLDTKIYFDKSKYIVEVSGKIEIDTKSLAKVEEMAEVEFMASLADAEREAMINNKLVIKTMKGDK